MASAFQHERKLHPAAAGAPWTSRTGSCTGLARTKLSEQPSITDAREYAASWINHLCLLMHHRRGSTRFSDNTPLTRQATTEPHG